jgi:hypothetical protein
VIRVKARRTFFIPSIHEACYLLFSCEISPFHSAADQDPVIFKRRLFEWQSYWGFGWLAASIFRVYAAQKVWCLTYMNKHLRAVISHAWACCKRRVHLSFSYLFLVSRWFIPLFKSQHSYTTTLNGHINVWSCINVYTKYTICFLCTGV